jgi:hypothetical protein
MSEHSYGCGLPREPLPLRRRRKPAWPSQTPSQLVRRESSVSLGANSLRETYSRAYRSGPAAPSQYW